MVEAQVQRSFGAELEKMNAESDFKVQLCGLKGKEVSRLINS